MLLFVHLSSVLFIIVSHTHVFLCRQSVHQGSPETLKFLNVICSLLHFLNVLAFHAMFLNVLKIDLHLQILDVPIFDNIQGSHRLEKALNLKGCLEKALNDR